MGRILGYADQFSVAPGETIRFMVSCENVGPSYAAEIVRMRAADDSPAGPGLETEPVDLPAIGAYPARRQSIAAGSYGVVPDHAAFHGLESLTLAAWIWPTTPNKGRQGIVARLIAETGRGFGLCLDAEDGLVFEIARADGTRAAIATDRPLLARRWYFVAATFDAATGRAHVAHQPRDHDPFAGDRGIAEARVEPGEFAGPGLALLLGARQARKGGSSSDVAGHYNGKIDSPRLYRRALSADELGRLAAGQRGVAADALVAAWDLGSEMTTTHFRDASGNGLDGVLVNLPTRAMTGWNWTGETQSWRDAPEQYGAVHFHDDDLYDCGWAADFTLTVPETMRSGVYAARLAADEAVEFVPFYVRARPGGPKEKVVFLAPTASYMAYGNIHWMDDADANEIKMSRLNVLTPADAYLNEHPEIGLSTYDHHSDGSGVACSSRLRPILDMRPNGISWCFDADSHITDWLEAKDFAYDVLTDEDLHCDGRAALDGYRVLITGSHPEYWSAPMLDALAAFTAEGGRLMYMGGNGFYWRTAFHSELPGVIEVRRSQGSRTWTAEPGEHYHGFDGAFGGTWRAQGRPPQRLVGVGFCLESMSRCGHYRLTDGSRNLRVAFIVEGIGADDSIGDFGVHGGAAGLECDHTNDLLGTPPHAVVVATSEDLSGYALLVPEEVEFTHTAMSAEDTPRARADIVFFETPGGGAVFSTGSIAWAGSLCHDGYDNNVSRMTENVLGRFLTAAPFRVPGES